MPRKQEDALAILDACECQSAVFVCQSMGGWTGLHAATEHPARVDGLVLCGTPGGLLTPSVIEAAGKIGTRVDGDGVRGNAALAPDYPSRQPAMAFLYDQIASRNEGFDPAWLARMFDEQGRVQESALEGYAVPTLLLAGECDQLFPPEALREVAALIPGAKLRELAGLGHSTYFEDAPRFNAILDEFLDGLS